MVLNYTNVLYRPSYSLHGVVSEIVLANDQIISVVALDKSGGVEIFEDRLGAMSMRPAAKIMMADLIELSLTPEDLRGALINLNGVSWSVHSYHPQPSPAGEADGELYLILLEPEPA